MSIETEVKVLLENAEEFRQRLRALNADLVSGRHFEDNLVLDFPDGRIRSQQGLLRVRLTAQACFATYKGPPDPIGLFKTREELETRVEDGEIALQILARLGMIVWFRYQKYREEYALPAGGIQGGMVHVALDVTPIGNFAEFEGSEDGIRMIARSLGFHDAQFLKDSYYSLFSRFCTKRGEPVTHMIFPSGGSGNAGGGREDFR